jgi:hypothetical protein
VPGDRYQRAAAVLHHFHRNRDGLLDSPDGQHARHFEGSLSPRGDAPRTKHELRMMFDIEHVLPHEVQDVLPVFLVHPGVPAGGARGFDRQFDPGLHGCLLVERELRSVSRKFEDMFSAGPQTGLFDSKCEPALGSGPEIIDHGIGAQSARK